MSKQCSSLHRLRLELRLGLSALTLDRQSVINFSFFLEWGWTKIYRTSSDRRNPPYSVRKLFSSPMRSSNESGEGGRKGGGWTKLCKTVAGLYFNLIHGSGNREDRPRRRWLKTRDVRELRSPGTRLAGSPPCGRFHPCVSQFPSSCFFNHRS